MITNAVGSRKTEEAFGTWKGVWRFSAKSSPIGAKGFTKAGIHKMIARIHEELAVSRGVKRHAGPSLADCLASLFAESVSVPELFQ